MMIVSDSRCRYPTQTPDTVQRIELENEEKFERIKNNYASRVENLKVSSRNTHIDACRAHASLSLRAL